MTSFEETELQRLNKQATALKKAGDMDGAIAALRRAKASQGDLYEDTKLALYLQQAGRFDESMAEFAWLLTHSSDCSQAMFGHQPNSVIQAQRATWCARIHAKAQLACEREMRLDLAAEHAQRAEKYMSIAQRLRPLGDQEIKAKRAAWDEAKRQGPKAMQAYLATHKGF